MFLVDTAHESRGGRKDLIDEDEDGFFRGQFDALADDIDKLPDRQVRGDEIFLLVDGGDVALFDLFADHLLNMKIISIVIERSYNAQKSLG